LSSKYNENANEYLAGRLPDSCLLSMIAQKCHLKDPLEEYGEKISDILIQALRINFQSQKPSSERRLQEAGEAMLVASKERLRRESPTLSFSVVQTRPDFSNIPNFNNLLFIEFKFLNSRQRLNRMITEITSRILIYQGQGAFVLFIVYDANDFIVNDEEFVRDLEIYNKVKIKIVR